MTDTNKSEYIHLSAHLNEIPICTSYAMTLSYSTDKNSHVDTVFDLNITFGAAL